ncbi:RNA-directed DNA polymerase, eukaryota [Tanacetum coccineum]
MVKDMQRKVKVMSSNHGHVIINFQFPKRLSHDQAADLEIPITRDEIRTAVWKCGENKSPGPDGFTFEFFRKFWDVIGADFCVAVEWFFQHSSFVKGCNSSFITLIPKTLDSKFVSDYRPISLIGSLYKVVTKVLATRLSFVISGLVSDVQTAFLSNRQILDGPFIINELLSWCKFRKQHAMVFKVDFAKAYDSIRWDYLDEVLDSFGFGSKWRSWISGSLLSGMASIIINGSPTSEFQLHRGLKQGDPLAPYLFILVMESFHLSITRATDAGLFKGIKIDSSLMISHLFYADDAVFIGEWSEKNVENIMHILHCFSLVSGLKINLQKSHLLGVGISTEIVNAAAMFLGCSVMRAPFKYLGVMVGGNTSLVKSWDEIIGKLNSRLSKWKSSTLSIGGRLTLLKSVLGSSPIYTMSLYKRWRIEAHQLSQLQLLVGPVILSNANDRWVWSLSGDGVFQVKDIRRLLDESFLPKDNTATRWVKFIPIKINVFAWKVSIDRLPTRMNLLRRDIHVPDFFCPICKDSTEDSSHLFFSCDLAVDISRLVCRWWNLTWSPLASYDEWLTWFKGIRLGSKIKNMLEGVFYIAWWSIWNFRNCLLFAAQNPRKDIIFDDIVMRAYTWCHARCNSSFSWDSWLQHPYLISL